MIKMLISRDKKRVTINVDIVPWKEKSGDKTKDKTDPGYYGDYEVSKRMRNAWSSKRRLRQASNKR